MSKPKSLEADLLRTVVNGLHAVGVSAELIRDANHRWGPLVLAGLKGRNHLFRVIAKRRAVPRQQQVWDRKWCGSVLTVRSLHEAYMCLGIMVAVDAHKQQPTINLSSSEYLGEQTV